MNCSTLRNLLLFLPAATFGSGDELTPQEPVHREGGGDPVRSEERRTLSAAEDFFLRFPDKLEGAAEVRKFWVDGAEICLLHVKQSHSSPQITVGHGDNDLHFTIVGDPERSELERIDEVQSRVYKILTTLIKDFGIQGIRIEGAFDVPAGDPGPKEPITARGVTLARYQQLQALTGLNFYPGAAGKLVTEGKVNALAADSLFIMQAAESLRAQWTSFESIWQINKDREIFLLDKASASSEPVQVTVYGFLHYFGRGPDHAVGFPYSTIDAKSNLATWNEAHPDRRIALIEIIPDGLLEQEIELRGKL